MFLLGPLMVACSGDSEDSAPTTVVADQRGPELPLGEVAVAIAGVEDDLGGEQRYTEINVGQGLVNVFVALDDGTELAYVYRDGALEPPEAPTPQPEGAVLFGLDGVDVSAVEGFDDLLLAELPGAAVVGMSLSGAAAGGVQWTATVLGSKGSVFDVLLSPTGEILGALPR